MTDKPYREAFKTMTREEIETATKIRQLNDKLRKTGPHRNDDLIVVMGDLAQDDPELQILALHQARQFDAFTEDNDPYGEHDCATFKIPTALCREEEFMFKIDYYDRNLEFGSNDPADPTITRRVMTLMYARDR